VSELPPYPNQPVPPGPEGQPPYVGPWVPPQGSQYPPPGAYVADPLISPDYGGWWQRGIAVAKIAWRQILVLQAIVAVLTFTVQTVAGAWQSFALRDLERASDAGRDPDFGTFFAGTALVLVGSVVVALVAMLATLAVVRIVVVAATGGQPNVGEALAGAARRVFPMLGWGILAGLLTVVGICACIVPGLYFAAVFLVLAPVVAIERGNAISRCFKLFHGDVGASLARIATLLGITVGVSIVAGIIGFIGGAAAPPATASTGALIASAAVTAAFGAVIGGALRILTDPLTVAAYADMRARVEPLSSAMLAQELAIR
jgi:hypothetical protein